MSNDMKKKLDARRHATHLSDLVIDTKRAQIVKNRFGNDVEISPKLFPADWHNDETIFFVKIEADEIDEVLEALRRKRAGATVQVGEIFKLKHNVHPCDACNHEFEHPCDGRTSRIRCPSCNYDQPVRGHGAR